MSQEILSESIRLYRLPLLDLIEQAHQVHRAHHEPKDIQLCALLSVKTGGCPEDCSYCPQSAHYKTRSPREPLKELTVVRQAIQDAKKSGATRFCMGAAWRGPDDGKDFDRVLEMVRAVKEAGMQACVTLGLLNPMQAQRLKHAGLDAYNHNIDTSRDYYSRVISTRSYDDRIRTLRHVREAGITVCSGGIIGMGESIQDRCAMIAELAAMQPQPESVPINLLIPVAGTPLENAAPVPPLELVRIVAVARMLLPQARIRLSAGRDSLSVEAQTLAFYAGANSVFFGEKLLTRSNPTPSADERLLDDLCRGNTEALFKAVR